MGPCDVYRGKAVVIYCGRDHKSGNLVRTHAGAEKLEDSLL